MRAVTVGPGIHGASPAESPPASDRRHSQLNRGTSPPRGRDTESLAGLGLAPATQVDPHDGHGPRAEFEDEFPVRQFVTLVRRPLGSGRLRVPPGSALRCSGKPETVLRAPWHTIAWSVGGRARAASNQADPPRKRSLARAPVTRPVSCLPSGQRWRKTPIGLRCVSALGEGSPLSGCPVAPCSVAPKASISAACRGGTGLYAAARPERPDHWPAPRSRGLRGLESATPSWNWPGPQSPIAVTPRRMRWSGSPIE